MLATRPGSTALPSLALLCALACGCGINKSRLATEQLVVSDAVDKAVATIDFSALSGKKVYFDTQYLDGLNMGPNGNVKYVISSLRQQMMAYDLRLQEKADTADFIVEGRVGVLANDGYEVTYGIPGGAAAASATAFLTAPVPISAPQMPELSLGRRNHQAGSAKIGLFAYDRVSREPVWQAGVRRGASDFRDSWLLGLGPYQSRTKPKRPWKSSEVHGADINGDPLSAYTSPIIFERAVRPAPPITPGLTPVEIAPASNDQSASAPRKHIPMSNVTPPQIVDISHRVTGSPRVLIVRLSAVGDCIQTMPLACAIRDHWPHAHVTWVVEKGSAPLVQACDAVDRVIVLPKRFATSPRILAWLWRELRPARFDWAFDPQGLTKSGMVAWLSGSRRRIGFARPVGRELSPWLQTELVTSHAEHRIPRYLELLQPPGIVNPKIRFGLSLPADAEKKGTEFLAQADFRSGYVALNPGAGWDSKRWPRERYAELARSLERRGIRSVITWGGDRERRWAESIVAESQDAAILAPPTSLLELAAILRKAKLFVGSDTGPLHLAAAVGTPCVAMFGVSSATGCGPYGRGHICLQAAFDQSLGRKRAGADDWAMRLITVDSVFQAVHRLLAAQAAGRSAA